MMTSHVPLLSTPQLYTRRNCPVCECEEVYENSRCSSHPPAESADMNALKEHWSGFFKEKIFFSYYRCKNCRTFYCPTYFSNDQLNQLYKSMAHNMADVPLKSLEKTQCGYFDVLRKFSPLTGDYLEVGTDQGFLAHVCAKKGDFKFMWLFEPNQVVHPELERKIAGTPYKIFPSMFDFHIVPKAQISVLSMVHVLDHLLNPRRILEDMRPILTNGAVLLFVTHDESSLLSRFLRGGWPPFCLQHPQLFSPNTIARLLESSGYKVLDVVKSYNHYPIGYLIRHLLWAMGMSANWLPNLFSFPLRLGNIITVATPKN
jgi:hypothetical protein